MKMPESPSNIYNELLLLAQIADGHEDIICYLERVGGYMPGNSGPASVKFARHCGHIEMALIAIGIKRIEVLPVKWMKYFMGRIEYPPTMTAIKRKTMRKNLIKARAQLLYPDIKVTLALSDALGILNYGLSDGDI